MKGLQKLRAGDGGSRVQLQISCAGGLSELFEAASSEQLRDPSLLEFGC